LWLRCFLLSADAKNRNRLLGKWMLERKKNSEYLNIPPFHPGYWMKNHMLLRFY